MNAIPSVRGRTSTGGFTLIEMLVVMGILTGFLIMLVQLVDSGLRMFGEGELGQALADRTSQAQRVIGRELASLRGSATGRDRDTVDDRLVVQQLPLGLPARPEAQPSKVQVLRGAVHLDRDRELPLAEAMLIARIMAQKPDATETEVQEQAIKERPSLALLGIGNLLLLPWRQEGADEALLELRAGWFLPGQMIAIGPDRFADPFLIPVPGSPDLPGLAVYQATQPVLRDLLHVEFAFWSQRTRQWGDGSNVTGTSTALRVWDSARGGWLTDMLAGGTFPLDRGPQSLDDPRDDVQPHAILVRCVVAQPAEFAAEGLLAAPLDIDDTAASLYDGSRFPGRVEGGFIKLRGEWIGYASREGDRLIGLRRGLRDTKMLEHPAGTRVHVGRSVEFVVPLAHAKDDWNG